MKTIAVVGACGLMGVIATLAPSAEATVCTTYPGYISNAGAGDLVFRTPTAQDTGDVVAEILQAMSQSRTHVGMDDGNGNVLHNTRIMSASVAEQHCVGGDIGGVLLSPLNKNATCSGASLDPVWLQYGGPGDGLQVANDFAFATGPWRTTLVKATTASAAGAVTWLWQRYASPGLGYSLYAYSQEQAAFSGGYGDMCAGTMVEAMENASPRLPSFQLQTYTQAQRLEAVDAMFSLIETTADSLSAVGPNGQAIASQVINCFAFNQCGSFTESWSATPGAGQYLSTGSTISPDDLVKLAELGQNPNYATDEVPANVVPSYTVCTGEAATPMGVHAFVKHGDNGTASCETYCQGAQFGQTGVCLAAQQNGQSIDCLTAPGLITGGELTCLCDSAGTTTSTVGTNSCTQACAGTGACAGATDYYVNVGPSASACADNDPDNGMQCYCSSAPAAGATAVNLDPSSFVKHGDMGTVSCATYCEGPQWGQVGRCIDGTSGGNDYGCNESQGPNGVELTCLCAAAEDAAPVPLGANAFVKHGNYGAVSCSAYCSDPNWAVPGTCLAAQMAGGAIDCAVAPGASSTELTCLCDSSGFAKPGDNGSVSCNDFCGGSQWGEVGACVRAGDLYTGAAIPCDAPNPDPLACTCVSAPPGGATAVKLDSGSFVKQGPQLPCASICAQPQWGAVGQCVDGTSGGDDLGCNSVPTSGVGAEMTCLCTTTGSSTGWLAGATYSPCVLGSATLGSCDLE
jgi:hypothetical protein